jgi:hypothetical protein
MYVSADFLNPMLLEGDWVIDPGIDRACIRSQSYRILQTSVSADLLNLMLLESNWVSQWISNNRRHLAMLSWSIEFNSNSSYKHVAFLEHLRSHSVSSLLTADERRVCIQAVEGVKETPAVAVHQVHAVAGRRAGRSGGWNKALALLKGEMRFPLSAFETVLLCCYLFLLFRFAIWKQT